MLLLRAMLNRLAAVIVRNSQRQLQLATSATPRQPAVSGIRVAAAAPTLRRDWKRKRRGGGGSGRRRQTASPGAESVQRRDGGQRQQHDPTQRHRYHDDRV